MSVLFSEKFFPSKLKLLGASSLKKKFVNDRTFLLKHLKYRKLKFGTFQNTRKNEFKISQILPTGRSNFFIKLAR